MNDETNENLQNQPQQKLSCFISYNAKQFLLAEAIKKSVRLEIKVTVSDIVNQIISKAMREARENDL